jgi:hypothetical protein
VAPKPKTPVETTAEPPTDREGAAASKTIRIVGNIPPEIWNRLGTKLLPKLKGGTDLNLDVGFSVTVDAEVASHLESEIRQIIQDLGLTHRLEIKPDG